LQALALAAGASSTKQQQQQQQKTGLAASFVKLNADVSEMPSYAGSYVPRR
jgi:hypothetical protein